MNGMSVTPEDPKTPLKTRKGIRLWPVFYGILLTAYAVFTLLDAFVIPQDMVSLEEIGENTGRFLY